MARGSSCLIRYNARVKAAIALLVLGLLTGCGNSAAPPATQSTPTKTPDENATLAAISKISEGQAVFFKLNRRYALTLDELVAARLLDAEPTSPQTGYEFNLRPAADAQTYKLSVSPVAASSPARHFFTDQSGAIHAEAGKDANAESPALAK
jgi:hypothetical protein